MVAGRGRSRKKRLETGMEVRSMLDFMVRCDPIAMGGEVKFKMRPRWEGEDSVVFVEARIDYFGEE